MVYKGVVCVLYHALVKVHGRFSRKTDSCCTATNGLLIKLLPGMAAKASLLHFSNLMPFNDSSVTISLLSVFISRL